MLPAERRLSRIRNEQRTEALRSADHSTACPNCSYCCHEFGVEDGVDASDCPRIKGSQGYHEITTKSLDLPRNLARYRHGLQWSAMPRHCGVSHEIIGRLIRFSGRGRSLFGNKRSLVQIQSPRLRQKSRRLLDLGGLFRAGRRRSKVRGFWNQRSEPARLRTCFAFCGVVWGNAAATRPSILPMIPCLRGNRKILALTRLARYL
jgi:hypothetical protein